MFYNGVIYLHAKVGRVKHYGLWHFYIISCGDYQDNEYHYKQYSQAKLVLI